ncbi:MAG: metal ABC transporter substrate-binding protein, partial [Oscillospiraceae bacterium]|nr:metal ABC transporter substrate-binding protein [Oscillospiraceae bacterium]
MKKNISFIIAVLLIAGCLSACGSGSVQPAAESGRLRIVTTIFPEYDWVINVLGDSRAKADVSMLLDTGVDLHSFRPTAADILKISDCDLFIYVGGESDDWVDDALREAENKDMIVVDLLAVLGGSAKAEETVEGMQAEEDHEAEEAAYDEHVWLSLRCAAALVGRISEAVQSLDPGHADVYRENAEAYLAKLDALDAAYGDAVSEAAADTLLFGDRFPFRYLTDDYGLRYYAAFAGCSAETE